MKFCVIHKIIIKFLKKYLVLGSGTIKTFRLSSLTPLGFLLTSCPGKHIEFFTKM